MSEQRAVAVYIRVSSKKQDTRSQKVDLERWVAAFVDDSPVRWYEDKASGQSMDRPNWKRLEDDIATGAIRKVVVWRLDRLGRTAAGLTVLFEDLQRRGVGFESIRDKVDLATAAGRLMANVLASVAAYENEVRGERIKAGQEAARAEGKRWGGSRVGRRSAAVSEKQETVRQLYANGMAVAKIARTCGISRPTVYSLIES